MEDSQRTPIYASASQPDMSTASTSTDSSAAQSLKRRYTSDDVFYPAPPMSLSSSQSHYSRTVFIAAKHAPTQPTIPVSRGHLPPTLPSMDPTPSDPDTTFIHPPFTDFPDAHLYREGLTYNVMAANPNWFLDPADYQTVSGGNPTAVKYPTQLEPPRGWCPSKKKDAKDGWPEGEEPRLRCTFCRRTYAGVNAKSMWRRHVFEKHKIAMSNRRADNQERKGRNANSTSSASMKDPRGHANSRSLEENKGEGSKGVPRGAARAEQELEAVIRAPGMKSKSRSMGQLFQSNKPSSSRSRTRHSPSDSSDEDDVFQSRTIEPQLVLGDSSLSVSFDADSSDVFGMATSANTPPLTPGLSPSSSGRFGNSKAESPYNPLLTPSFKHSPRRLTCDQPWRFPSPSHPLHSSARELSLSMLVCGEGSPTVRGLDVSPVVLVPASERSKRSIFSSPFSASKKETETPGFTKALPKPSPRTLFTEAGLPTPLTDRLKFQKHRIPESPLGKSFTPNKSKTFASLAQRSDAFRSSFSPAKASPLKTPHKGTGLLGPFDFSGNDDPFTDSLYKAWLRSPSSIMQDGDPISPPDSSPECESPVVRTSQISQTEALSSSQFAPSAPKMAEADSSGLGFGLMEGFSLRDRSASSSSDSETEVDDQLLYPSHSRKRAARWLGRSYATADGSPAPVAHAGKKIKREFLMDRLLDGDQIGRAHV